MEFKKVKLKDITTRITKGTTPNKEAFNSKEVTYIKSDSLNYNGFMDEYAFVRIDEKTHRGKLKRSILSENDILYSIAGAYLGKVGIVKRSYLPANTNQAVGIITVKENIVLPKYIYYYLQQYKIRHFANNSISQSAQPNINLEQLGNFDIDLCEIENQKKIVKILDKISKKIELNNQMNDNLHKIILSIYIEKIKNNQNDEFEIKTLDEICNVFTGKKNANASEDDGKYKFFTCAPEPLNINTFIYDGPAIVVAGNGAYTGRTTFYNGKFDLYQRTYAITEKELNDYIYLLYAMVKSDLQENIMGGTHGSAIPYIVMDDIAKFKVKYNEKIFDDLSQKIKCMLIQIKENEKENYILSQLRDTLLPKFMNGEIDLDKVEN